MNELKKLKDLIHLKGYSQRKIAQMMGMSISAFQNRVNGKVAFYLDEAMLLAAILDIPPEEITSYFVA